MQVIGVTGRKRHGKDSVGRYLGDTYGFKRYAFADKVKDVGDIMVGVAVGSWRKLSEAEKELPIAIPGWEHITWRALWQKIGTEMGRAIDLDVWIRATFSEAQAAGDAYVVVTDVRYPNEARAIRDRGGIVLKVVRPDHANDGDTHTSETSVDEIVPDALLWNDADLTALYQEVDRALEVFDTFGLRSVG